MFDLILAQFINNPLDTCMNQFQDTCTSWVNNNRMMVFSSVLSGIKLGGGGWAYLNLGLGAPPRPSKLDPIIFRPGEMPINY